MNDLLCSTCAYSWKPAIKDELPARRRYGRVHMPSSFVCAVHGQAGLCIYIGCCLSSVGPPTAAGAGAVELLAESWKLDR
jgi:hypothetical protein